MNTALQIRESFRGYRKTYLAAGNKATPISKGQKGLIINLIEDWLKSEDYRHLVMGWMIAENDEKFQPISTKDIKDDSWWFAFWTWLEPLKEERFWTVRLGFYNELSTVFAKASDDFSHALNREERGKSGVDPLDPVLYASGELGGKLRGVTDEIEGKVATESDTIEAIRLAEEELRRSEMPNRGAAKLQTTVARQPQKPTRPIHPKKPLKEPSW